MPPNQCSQSFLEHCSPFKNQGAVSPSHSTDPCIATYSEAYQLGRRLVELFKTPNHDQQAAAQRGIQDAVEGLQPLREFRADDF